MAKHKKDKKEHKKEEKKESKGKKEMPMKMKKGCK
jgi:hypothetical protein